MEPQKVAAVNVCTMMTFLAYAQHKGLGLISYESEAEGVLENVDGKYRFTEVNLHPHLRVKTPEEIEHARTILNDAHKTCLVANSITASVKVFPQFHAG